jgi:CMP-N-acetylneuraminic acid synthetase
VGDRVVLSGCYECDRYELEEKASRAGRCVLGSVSAKTKLLVSDGTNKLQSVVRVEAVIPLKERSVRVGGKNRRRLGEMPLYHWILDTCIECEAFDAIDIYSSSKEFFTDYGTSDVRVRWVSRPHSLDDDNVSMTEVLHNYCQKSTADVIVLLHATSPFLTCESITACIDAVTSGNFDSAFAVVELQRFAWFQGRPLNYSLTKSVPRTQDLPPLVVEQSGLYAFKRDAFLATSRRIGETPRVVAVQMPEAIDLDDEFDFVTADAIIQMRADATLGIDKEPRPFV